MIGIHQQNDVAFPDFACEIVPFLWKGRGIDDGGGGYIFGSSEGWGDMDLGENWLNLVRNKDTFDKRGDEAGLASPLIAANANANWIIALSAMITANRGK